MDLSFDIITQIALQSDHNTLLSLRATCNEVKDFTTPLSFRHLRVRCNTEGFERLEDFGINGQTLSALVLDLKIEQAEDIRFIDVIRDPTLQLHSQIASHLHMLLPNLRTMSIQFPEYVNTTASDSPNLSQETCLRNFCNPSIKLQHLRHFEVLNIAGSVLQGHFGHTTFFASLTSLSITNKKQYRLPPDYFPFSRSLNGALQALSQEKLTKLRIGTSDKTQPPPHIDPTLHFPNLSTLELEQFQLDDSQDNSLTETLAAFVIRHQVSLVDLTLHGCWLIVTQLLVPEEKRVQAWLDEAGIVALVK